MATPHISWLLLRVIVWEVGLWNLWIDACIRITPIFLRQRFCVVFRVAGNKYLTTTAAGKQIGPGFLRSRQHIQVGVVADKVHREVRIT